MYYIDESEDADSRAAEHIERLFLQYREQPVLFLASGGSAHKVVEALSTVTSIPTEFTLTLADERFTEHADDRNFPALAASKFFCRCIDAGANAFDPYTSSLPLEEAASTFSEQLNMWKKAHKNGVVVALLGIGSDGHIAGILPDPEHEAAFVNRFVETSHAALGYEVPPEVNQHTQRITTTIAFLREVDHAVVYAVRSEKQEALAKLTSENGSLAATPARIVRDMHDVHLHVFV